LKLILFWIFYDERNIRVSVAQMIAE
jgi:hypothetical protein